MTLDLSILEQNDAKALVFTDTSDWTGESVSNISVLTLTLTIKTLGEEVTYDAIDLLSEFGPFSQQSDMVYTITPDMLLVSGQSQFTSDDMIPDAVVDVVYYAVNPVAVTTDTLNQSVFTYEQIKNKVYNRLRAIPSTYMAYDYRSKEISDTLLMYSLIKGMEASAYVALEEELLNTLDATEKLYINGSNYTWQ